MEQAIVDDITIMKKKVQDTQEGLLKDNIRMNEEMKKLVEEKVKDQFYNLKRELKQTEEEQKSKISKIKWKTGLVTFLVGLLLSAIFDRSSCSKAQTQHYFSHETSHAFSVVAQDVFSNRQRAGIGNYNIPYFYTTRIGNSEYLGISGSIYKKLQPNEKENVIYGGGFCEVMTDLFAVASKVASSPDMKNQEITVDTVLKKPNKEWNKERITSGYFASMPLARLAIAAFSNYPNPQYQHILNTGGSIFSTMRTDTNAEVHINDFIYGSMCDPLYIAEEYDKIAGQPGAYFKLCQPMDKIVDDYAYKRPADNKDIQFVIQQLSKFAKHRTMIKVQEGVFTQEYADKIYEEFEKVKSDVEREYGLSDKYQQISNQNPQITPTVIAETSKNAIKGNPGIVAEK